MRLDRNMQLVPNRGGEVSLSNSRQSKDQQVFGAGHKFAAAQLSQLAGEAQGQFFLVESCQGFACGQMGGFLQALDAALAAPLDFLFKQFRQEGFEWPDFAGGSGVSRSPTISTAVGAGVRRVRRCCWICSSGDMLSLHQEELVVEGQVHPRESKYRNTLGGGHNSGQFGNGFFIPEVLTLILI